MDVWKTIRTVGVNQVKCFGFQHSIAAVFDCLVIDLNGQDLINSILLCCAVVHGLCVGLRIPGNARVICKWHGSWSMAWS